MKAVLPWDEAEGWQRTSAINGNSDCEDTAFIQLAVHTYQAVVPLDKESRDGQADAQPGE